MPLTLRLSLCELQKFPLPQQNGGMGVQVPAMPREVHIGPLDLHMGSVQGLPDILPCLLRPGCPDGTQSAGESHRWSRVRDLAFPSPRYSHSTILLVWAPQNGASPLATPLELSLLTADHVG